MFLQDFIRLVFCLETSSWENNAAIYCPRSVRPLHFGREACHFGTRLCSNAPSLGSVTTDQLLSTANFAHFLYFVLRLVVQYVHHCAGSSLYKTQQLAYARPCTFVKLRSEAGCLQLTQMFTLLTFHIPICGPHFSLSESTREQKDWDQHHQLLFACASILNLPLFEKYVCKHIQTLFQQ